MSVDQQNLFPKKVFIHVYCSNEICCSQGGQKIRISAGDKGLYISDLKGLLDTGEEGVHFSALFF